MKSILSTSLCLFLLCLSIGSLTAQKLLKKEKFGKPSMKELEMTVYAKDSTAAAVILFDIGYFNSLDIKFTRHMRIKILTPAGLSWANQTFDTPSKSEFKVVSNTLIDGELVTEKAGRDNIYEEDIIDDYSVYKVFTPNVRVGSVIDIQYSHLGIPSEWRFQSRIPIVYNELLLEESQYLTYNKNFMGFEPIETLASNHWKAEHVVAFVSEPYVSNYSNYINKFQFQLVSYGSGASYFSYSTTWARVNHILLENSNFGSLIKGAGFINNVADEIKSSTTNVEEMIQAAYDTIQSHIKWDGRDRVLASDLIKNIYQKTHSGSSADINLLLIALLNELEIRVYPVVLSTRDNGYVLQHSPSIDRLNYVVAYVKHDDIELFIDATSPNLIPGYLPKRCFNHLGLIVKEDTESWLDLQNGTCSDRQFTKININEDGTVEGTHDVIRKLYSYYDWVKNYESYDKNTDIYIGALADKFNDVTITNYELVNVDRPGLLVKEKFELDLTNKTIDTGDGLLLSPFVLSEYASNPFLIDHRNYPVDMVFKKNFEVTIIIDAAENLKPKTIPTSMRMTTSDGSAAFTLICQQQGNSVKLKLDIEMTKSIYTEAEYPELKQFYGEISRIINQPIEFEKI